jgi:hypothetical protein
MESDVTPEQALAAAERATAAVWIDYPPTPAWYYPAMGAWWGALVLSLGALYDDPLLLVAPAAVLIGSLAWFVSWYTRYRGTLPKGVSAPKEFRPAIAALAAGEVVMIALAAALCLTAGPLVAALVTFVGATAGLWVYERAYEAAAAATRERLGEAPG